MKMIVEEWGDGYENSGVSVTLIKSDGKEMNVTFRDGEREDMVIARDLSDATYIASLIKTAYDAGKTGEELIIEYKDIEE